MIIGDGIRFRAIERSDLPRYVNWLNDPEVRQYINLFHPISLAFEEQWYEKMISLPVEEQAMMMEVITEDGWKPIGNIGLMSVSNVNRDAELGLFIKLLLVYAFNTLNLNRIYLRVVDENQRGIHTYKAVGFVEEGRMREAVFLNGSYHDMILMSVLRSEWQS